MDQVWHPPIDPAPRGAVGLARIYADAYGKLQSGRCDVGQFGRCDVGHALPVQGENSRKGNLRTFRHPFSLV